MADERFEQIEDEIQHARRTAEDADILDDPDEPKFYKSGSKSEFDDQTIAPG